MKINPEDFEIITYNIIKEAALRDIAVTDNMIQEAAQESVRELRRNSPRDTGDYAEGWAMVPENGKYFVRNLTDWQLTHLLEDGTTPRKTKDGKSRGKMDAQPHIYIAHKKSILKLKRKLKGGQT